MNEEDEQLLKVAIARTANDSGRRYSLKEVANELGIDLEKLDEKNDDT